MIIKQTVINIIDNKVYQNLYFVMYLTLKKISIYM